MSGFTHPGDWEASDDGPSVGPDGERPERGALETPSVGYGDPSGELARLRASMISLQQKVEQLRLLHNAHLHGGVTAGGANSGAPTAAGLLATPIVLH